jgi:hypothetical protein
MNHSHQDFRDRLIRAQKMSPEYERRYREQVDDMVSLRLTQAQRRLHIVGAACFLAVGIASFLVPAIRDSLGEGLRLRGVLIGAMFVVWSGYFVWMAWRGRYDPRTQPVIAGGLSLIIPIVIALTLLPGSLGELREYVAAFSIALLLLLWIVAVKLIRLDYGLKEKLLELDCRIAELAERLDQKRPG